MTITQPDVEFYPGNAILYLFHFKDRIGYLLPGPIPTEAFITVQDFIEIMLHKLRMPIKQHKKTNQITTIKNCKLANIRDYSSLSNSLLLIFSWELALI